MYSREPLFDTLFRTPARVVSAESHRELSDLLAYTMRALFRNLRRYEFYVVDGAGRLVPEGERRPRGAPAAGNALARLNARLLQEIEACPERRSYVVPALHATRRGPLMSAPLLDGRRLLGLIVAEADPGKPEFTESDLDLLEGVAGMFSLALLRLDLRQSRRVRASVDLDRKSAGTVQRRLMHSSLPAGAGVTVEATYLPALDVGGDFYELAYLGDGVVGAAIGDVSGKGVSAALIMSRVSSDVGRALRGGDEPSAVLRNVNANLTDLGTETFVTASCLRLDTRRGTLTVANAGHLPLLVRRASGEVFSCGRASGTPLGIECCDYDDERIDLEPRDIVLLMTDGLVEALDRPGDRMGREALYRAIHGAAHDPRSVSDRVLQVADEGWSASAPDDVTLVAMQLQAA